MEHILTLNGGSSSIKFALFELGDPLKRLLFGKVERIGLPDAAMEVTDLVTGHSERRAVAAPDHVSCVEPLAHFLEQRVTFDAIAAAGHRIVHGGPRYREPQVVTPEVLAYL